MMGIGVQELAICGCLLVPLILGVVLVIVVLLVRSSKRPASTAAAVAPGWLADPSGRHQLRYWDGAGWSAAVSDNGAESTDLL